MYGFTSTALTTLTLALATLTLAAPAPAPQDPPSCAGGITFKATFSPGDGLANIDLQAGSVHCFDNEPYDDDASDMPGPPFYLACDDNGATTASFTTNSDTDGTVVVTKPNGQGSFTYHASATLDPNGNYQYTQQALCPL